MKIQEKLIEKLPTIINFDYKEDDINTSIEVINLIKDKEHLVLIFYQVNNPSKYYLGTIVVQANSYRIVDDISSEFDLEDVYLQFENIFTKELK